MEKKEEVITTARELFKNYGYKKVSMDEIAKKSKVTKKTIYHYFKDKDALFQYFVTEELEQMKEKFEQGSNNPNLSVTERIGNGLKAILDFRKESPLVSSIKKEEELTGITSNFLSQYDEEIINYLEEKIKEEIKKGNIRVCNTKLTAFIIYKVFYSIFFEYSQELKEQQVIEEVTSILQKGLIVGGTYEKH